jgi:hypothetical protein
MKTKLLTCASLAVLLAATAMPASLAAQDKSEEKGRRNKQHSHQLIDMGTLAGSETSLSCRRPHLLLDDPGFDDERPCFSPDGRLKQSCPALRCHTNPEHQEEL